MNTASPTDSSPAGATLAEIHTELFAQFVTGHAQMTLMLLGRYPHPQTGEVEPPNPEAAKMFIDQLEMIEAKTRGNLTAEESRLLRQMLSAVQVEFAKVIDSQLSDEPVVPGGAGGSGTPEGR